MAVKVGTGSAITSTTSQFKPGNQWAYKPGQNIHTQGRSKGARDRLTHAFIEALQADFDRKGRSAIRHARLTNPTGYLLVVARLVPKEMIIRRSPLDDIPDDVLEALGNVIRSLEAGIGLDRPVLEGGASPVATPAGSKNGAA